MPETAGIIFFVSISSLYIVLIVYFLFFPYWYAFGKSIFQFLGYSYCGAQIFEVYGLGKEVVDLAFRGSVSKIGGLTFDEVRNIAD